jgi:glycosyltransferase 2 family protein
VALKKLAILIPLIMLPLGIGLGYRVFRDHSLAAIGASLAGIPIGNLALAFACSAASYLCLTGFDTLAVRYVGRSLPYRKIALTSFVSLSIGHNVGVAALSSGALRYRFYSGLGLGGVEVGKIILFCAVTVGLGLMSLGGLVLLLQPDFGVGLLGFTATISRGVGVLCLALVLGYVLLAWALRRPLCMRGYEFRLPSAGLAAAQVLIGTTNFALVAATLHQLFARAVAYPEVVAAYVLGNATALVSHVPGGLGVLEFVITSLVAHGHVVGALIAFRIIYYLVPLAIGSSLLIGAEIARWQST